MGARFISAWLLILLCGCSSVFTVKSEPLQADVYVLDPAKPEKKPIGKTPVEIPTGDLKQIVGESVMAGQYFTVVVEKQGFKPETLTIPATRFGTLVTALEVKLKPDDGVKEQRLAADILNRLFLAQKMARAKQYDRAHLELDKLLAEVPNFSRALSMRASIYFMQKNHSESLKWYEEALKADPQMEDAIKMVAKIRSMSGGRIPASPAQKGGKP